MWSVDRRDPYTAAGIDRLPCIRCQTKAAVHQWQVCADGNRWRPLCLDCDILLNRVVLKFMEHPDAERVASEYEKGALQ